MINTSLVSRFAHSIALRLLIIIALCSSHSSSAQQPIPLSHVDQHRDLLIPQLPGTTTAGPQRREQSPVRSLLPASQPSTSSGRDRRSHEAPDHPAEAAEFFRFKRLPTGEKDLPVEKYFEAQERMRLMPQYSTADNRFAPPRAELRDSPEQQRLGQWTPLGPGNIGGRTRALLIDPQTPDVMFAAGVAGGVWKSTDAGATWRPLTDLIANIAVNSMAFDPVDPSVIYAGTGEGYFNGDGVRGAGIFKTTDGGATWTRLQSTATEDFHFVNDIVVSSVNSRRVYAATRTGVWRSNDGGASWTIALAPEGSFGGTVTGGCLDLAIRTDQTTDYLLASCGTFEQATVYRNTDVTGRGRWTPVLTEPGMGRTAIAVAPSNQNVIYALASAFTFDSPALYGLHAVFRSIDGGETWVAQTRITGPNKMNKAMLGFPIFAFVTDCGFGFGDFFGGQAWYDLTIAVDPVDSDRLWSGGIDLFRSDDGGVNWGQAGFVYVFDPFLPKIHPDQHAIVFHPRYNGSTNQTLFIGNDGGLFRTDNARAAVVTDSTLACDPNNGSVQWKSMNNGYGVTQFYHGLPYPDGKRYIGGTQDNGTLLGADTAGINGWREVNGGDGGYVAIDPANPGTIYSAYTGISVQKSTDDCATFSSAVYGIADFGLFITPYVTDPSDPQRLWLGGFSTVWRSDDGAAHWKPASEFEENAVVIGRAASAVAVSQTNSNFVVAGTIDGSVLLNDEALTADRRTRWRSSIPRLGYVSWVAIDREIAYATYSTFGGDHVWRSDDRGLTWRSIDGSGAGRLPDIPVHCLVIDPSNPSRLYIGTDLGVFVTHDGAESWAVENTGFANAVTESLSLSVAGGVTSLYAFTHGRGAWRVTVDSIGCDYALSPATRSFDANGGTVAVNVAADPARCDWTATSQASWIKVSSNASGAGNGTVSLKIEKNETVSRRAGAVAIGRRSFTVEQEGRLDSIAPVLKIVSPRTNPAAVAAGSVKLEVEATDNDFVASVKWSTNRGASGKAVLTDSLWQEQNLPLATGENVITVTALDSAGNIGEAKTAVFVEPASVIVTVAGTGAPGFSGDDGAAAAAKLNFPISPIFDASGNLYFCDFNNHRIRRIATNGVITTVAGSGLRGYAGDGGLATVAKLNAPTGIAIDRAGNLFISDWLNHRVRRVDARTGVITTVAGDGSVGNGGDGGPAVEAQLAGPNGVTVDGAGNIYIADTGNNRVRRVSARDGRIAAFAGTGVAGFSGDGGPAEIAELYVPFGVVLDSADNLYIADSGNGRIRKVNAATRSITTIAGNGSREYDGENVLAARTAVGFISGLAFDGAGNLYFCDLSNRRVRRIAASTGLVRTLAGSSALGFSPDGARAAGAPLDAPYGVAVDAAGTVFFAEVFNSRVRKIVPAGGIDGVPPVVRITAPSPGSLFAATGSPISLRGTAIDNRSVAAVRWSNDRGGGGEAYGQSAWTVPIASLHSGLNDITVTAWDGSGNASSARLTVSFAPQRVIVTAAGNGAIGSGGDGGPATAAQLQFPVGVAVDAAGNAYFTDASNHRVRKISPSGVITAFAGTGALGSSGDGGLATAASMNLPLGIAVDSSGNVFVADTRNNRIRRIASSGVITTVAGTGRAGYGGDGGPAAEAKLASPYDVGVDAAGNLYIADTFNSRVRKVDARTGLISTIAGTGQLGSSGDGGPATSARFFNPSGVAIDAAGNVYVADIGDNRIRRVSQSDGKIVTVAGDGTSGFNGDDIPAVNAKLYLPVFLAIDPAGDLHLADQGNHRIRKIEIAAGRIKTVAGTGEPGSAGDGSAPSGAKLNSPTGVAFDRNGNLYIADQENHRIRKTQPADALRTVSAFSAASFAPEMGVAPDSIAAAFGTNFAATTQSANSLPLPLTLAGATVSVRDALGFERLARIFFASSGQINFLVPQGTVDGIAAITVTGSDGLVATGTARVSAVAPGIFTAASNGQGPAAAVALRVRADGTQSFEPVARFDASQNRFVTVPIDIGPATDQVFLIAFGTGLRHTSALSAMECSTGGVNAEVLFAGAQREFVGLDQINLRLPRSLIGRGEVDLVLAVDGKAANKVRVNIK